MSMNRHGSRRSLLRALPATLSLGAAGALAASGVGRGEPATSLQIDRPTTVTLLLNGNLTGTGTEIMRRLYETEFRSTNPNVTIDFQASGSSGAEHVTKLLALTAAGTSPDGFYLSNSGDAPALVSKGVVRALDDLIRGDAGYKREDWFDVQLNAWQLDRKQRGLPWQGGPLITYYNRELLTEAGVPTPTEASWTSRPGARRVRSCTARSSQGRHRAGPRMSAGSGCTGSTPSAETSWTKSTSAAP